MGRTITFDVCGRCLALEIGDAALAETLGRLFPGGVDPMQDGPDIPAQYRVARHPDGYALTSADGRQATYGDVVELAVALEFALTEAFLHECREYAHVHASGAVHAGRAVLMLGRAGSGKSSLAFAWSRAGAPTLGDDVVLLDTHGRAHAFKRLFKLAPTLLEAAGIALDDTPLWEQGAGTAWWDPAAAAGWADAAPVGLVVLARFEPNAPTTVREVPKRDALNALAHSLMSTGLPRAASFRTLSAVVEGAATVEVRFGSAADAVAVLAARRP